MPVKLVTAVYAELINEISVEKEILFFNSIQFNNKIAPWRLSYLIVTA